MNFKEKTYRELAPRLILDNESAFSELYVRYKDKLYSFCLHLLKSKEEANDIVQEIFIRLWESRSFINPSCPFLLSFIRWLGTAYSIISGISILMRK